MFARSFALSPCFFVRGSAPHFLFRSACEQGCVSVGTRAGNSGDARALLQSMKTQSCSEFEPGGSDKMAEEEAAQTEENNGQCGDVT